VRTFVGLKRLAREANEFRYSDLEKLLRGLEGDDRKLAVRIALVPLVEDRDAWRVLRPIILAALDSSALDDLRLANIVDREAEAPKFGHPKRRDAARAFLDVSRREVIKAEAERLILALAQSITAINASTAPCSAALVGLRDEARRQNLRPLPLALCEAAVRLFGERLPSSDLLIQGSREAERSPELGVGLVLAAALVNTAGDARANGDLARRDALLDELRALARAYPDVGVREQLAMGLFNTLNDAKAEDTLAATRCSTNCARWAAPIQMTRSCASRWQ
jgi:hypothetical protein